MSCEQERILNNSFFRLNLNDCFFLFSKKKKEKKIIMLKLTARTETRLFHCKAKMVIT